MATRVFSIEDGDEGIWGTFRLLSQVRFDTKVDCYVELDECTDSSEFLSKLQISLDDIRVVAGTDFPEFDEVRRWKCVSAEMPIMDGFVAFGPNDKAALVVHLSHDNVVDRMHFHIWLVDDEVKSVLPQIVDLFSRIAARWELLFETMNAEIEVTERNAALADDVSEFADGL